LTEKLRVYQVAKDFSISSEALIGILQGLGVSAKSHMSTLDPGVIDLVRDKFKEEKAVTKAEDARKQEAKAALEREAVRRAAPPPPPAATAPPPPVPAPPQARKEKEAPEVVEAPTAPRRPAPPTAPGPAAPKVQRRRGLVDEKTVRDSVKKTLANLDGAKSKRYKKRLTSEPPLPVAAEAGVALVEERGEEIKIPEMSSVAELAEILNLRPAEIITKLMGMGKMVTLNHRLDKDTIELLALEYGHAVRFVSEFGEEELDAEEETDRPEDMSPRPPVVTVMGHVDHGKTSLLDYIRKTTVVAGEKGGITQHIGAYEVRLPNGREVTFLDTPGHEAFTAMRARGAQVTDIVVLVVAADDRVMPQTIEALDHARAAEVPVIVAINKVDKPEANILRVKQDLANHNALIEEYGGKIPAVAISAKSGQGVDELLEIILLQADILELTANVKKPARGVVIESKIEQGRGRVATVLLQRGILEIGDPFLCGKVYGKVRSLSNERGKRVKKAGPSVPVEVTGFSDSSAAGDLFQVVESEGKARQLGQQRQLVAREIEQRERKQVTLTDFFDMKERGEVRELRLIIKADVGGSVEVLREQLGGLGTSEVSCRVIHSGVGPINESDVLLADASSAVIIGFGVSVGPRAAEQARQSQVDIRTYNIIYEAVEDVKSALSGLLKPEEVERVKGKAEVRQVFRVSKSGTVAGCYILEGTVARTHQARLLREGKVEYVGKIGSLRRFKDDVREVAQGFECGIGLEGHDDVREGDVIETFVIELVARRI
jgi:translation initiation factor IF-2